MDYLKCFYDWKSLDLKKLTKSQSLTFWADEFSSDDSEFVWWKNMDFCNVLNKEIMSRCCIEDVKINIQANRSSIEQKVNDSLSSIKTLIGRFKADHEKKLGIWRSNVDDWLR